MNQRPTLQHVSIPRPPDSDVETRRFYGDVLGLEEMTPPRSLGSLNVIWYRLGAAELHLPVEEPSGQDHSGHHFCIAVEDVESLRQQLLDAGIAVVGSTTIPGRPRYFIRDPFGNLIEITTIEHDYQKES